MVVSWGFYFVLCKLCVTISGSPFVTGFFLRFMTCAFLSMYWRATIEENTVIIPKKLLFCVILIGALTYTFDVLINIGFQYVSVSIGTILLKTEIFFVLLISFVFLKIRIKRHNYLFIILMLLGVVLCMNMQTSDDRFNFYSLMFIASAVLNAICAFAIKHIQEKYTVGSFAIVYTNNNVSLVLYAICAVIFSHDQILNMISEMSSLGATIGIFGVCSICQTLMMISYYRNLKDLPVWIVKSFLLFVPALSMIIEFFLLKATISIWSLLGFTFIFLGGLGITIDSKNT